MNETRLDKWDSKIITLFKRGKKLDIDQFKAVWAERCALDVKYVDIEAINQHFLKLAYDLGLFENEYAFREFIFNLNYDSNWKFTCSNNEYLKSDTLNFQLILLSRLDSLFSLTNVKNLPGYIYED